MPLVITVGGRDAKVRFGGFDNKQTMGVGNPLASMVSSAHRNGVSPDVVDMATQRRMCAGCKARRAPATAVRLVCDGDAVLLVVDHVGAACDTGDYGCFDAGVLLEAHG